MAQVQQAFDYYRSWLVANASVDSSVLMELFTAMLTIYFAPTYSYAASMKEFLQTRSFMALVVFGTIYISFQSVTAK